MIKYQLREKENSSITIIYLDSVSEDQKSDIKFEGSNQEEVADWLYYEMDRFGHFITDSTTPLDLASALSKQNEYEVTLLEGYDLIQGSPDKKRLSLLS